MQPHQVYFIVYYVLCMIPPLIMSWKQRNMLQSGKAKIVKKQSDMPNAYDYTVEGSWKGWGGHLTPSYMFWSSFAGFIIVPAILISEGYKKINITLNYPHTK